MQSYSPTTGKNRSPYETEQGEIIETQTVMLKFEETSLPDRQPIQPKLQQKVIRTLVLSPTVEESLPAKSIEEFELKSHQESLQDWENDTSEPDASKSCTAESDEKVDENDVMDESDIEEQRTVQQTVAVHIVDEQNSSEDKDREKPPDSKSEDT